MRDRLIELIEKWFKKPTTKYLADYLLANGVVCPPCKVGDVVYCVFEDDVIEDEIILIEATKNAIYLSTCTERYMWINGYLYSEMLDQKLYITKEEAEQALRGVKG